MKPNIQKPIPRAGTSVLNIKSSSRLAVQGKKAPIIPIGKQIRIVTVIRNRAVPI